jgi:hypothetical protein
LKSVSPAACIRFDTPEFANALFLAPLQEAWRKFPDMSHIMVADPDWEPSAAFPRAELDFAHFAFMFKIWDRNAHTTRLSEVKIKNICPGMVVTQRLRRNSNPPCEARAPSSTYAQEPRKSQPPSF